MKMKMKIKENVEDNGSQFDTEAVKITPDPTGEEVGAIINVNSNISVAEAEVETNSKNFIRMTANGDLPTAILEPQTNSPKYDKTANTLNTEPAYAKLQCEVAQIYRKAAMDAYIAYGELYEKISSDIGAVKKGNKFVQDSVSIPLSQDAPGEPRQDVLGNGGFFSKSISGLEDATEAVRHQMAIIVERIKSIDENSGSLSGLSLAKPFQKVSSFEERLPKLGVSTPKTETPPNPKKCLIVDEDRLKPKILLNTQPETDSSENPQVAAESFGVGNEDLSPDEQRVLSSLQTKCPTLGSAFYLTAPIGSMTKGTLFNNVEFLQPDWHLTSIRIEVADGAVVAAWVHYDNGVILSSGKSRGGTMFELSGFAPGERISSATIQTGKGPDDEEERVICVQLNTNRRRGITAQAANCSSLGAGRQLRDGVEYSQVKTRFFDTPTVNGGLKGFWGRSDDTGIWRLGFIWEDCVENGDKTWAGDLIITSCVAGAKEAEKTQQDYKNLTARYDDLKVRFATEEQTFDDLTALCDDLEMEHAISKQHLEDLTSQCDDLELSYATRKQRLEDLTAQCTDLKVQYEINEQDLEDLTDQCENLEVQYTNKERRLKKLIDNLKIQYMTEERRLKVVNAIYCILEANQGHYRTAKADIEKASLTWGDKNSVWRTKKVQIYFICIGGQAITSDDVARRIVRYAESHREFNCNQDTFSEVSWPNKQKKGILVYRYHNTGPLRYLVGREHDVCQFDPL